ncbi:MAG: hypothetical protein AAF703_10260 [Cyanobacteria bacterium P01_D01_bin.105]
MLTVADEAENIRTEMIPVETCQQLSVGEQAAFVYCFCRVS